MSQRIGEAREYDPLVDLTPKRVGKFLDVSGWELEEERDGVSQFWIGPDHESSLMLPLDSTFRDYSARFMEALRTISLVHGATGEALALEIASAASDILLLRADQFTRYGTIPLHEAQTLLDGARRMLAAAAVSTVRPRATTGGRRPNTVNDFLDNDVRMGHTLRGSFVITIFAELDRDSVENDGSGRETKRDRSDQAGNPVAPFSRQVFNTLATGLKASKELLGGGGQMGVDEAVARGVSAELLEALSDMTEPEGLKALDLAFRWSPADQRQLVAEKDSRIILDRDVAQSAAPVVEALRRKNPVRPQSIIGFVRRLERSPGDTAGTVIIEGTFDSKDIASRTLHVPLEGLQYAEAIRAHENGIPVHVSGVIERKGRSYVTKGQVQIRPI